MSNLQKAICGVLLVACIGGLLVAGFLGSVETQERRNAIARALDRQRDEKAAVCQAARGRAGVYARALGSPATATEAIAAARELAPWVPYCDGPRITIEVIDVDVFQLRSYLITFAQGD